MRTGTHSSATKTRKGLKTRLKSLEVELSEARDVLHAIRSGTIDSLLICRDGDDQVLTLKGADQAYRVMVEAMNEGAVTLQNDGTIIYCNSRFSRMVQLPIRQILGKPFEAFVEAKDRQRFLSLLVEATRRSGVTELNLKSSGGPALATQVSSNFLPLNDGICLVVTDISSSKEAEKVLHEFPRRLLEAQETERKRVARDLHDGVSQILSSARQRLHAVEKSLKQGPQTLATETSLIGSLVDRAIQELRAISRNLRPSELDDFGLASAIRSLCNDFELRTSVKVRSYVSPVQSVMPRDVEIALYRIIQEGLTNIEKHARAQRVDLTLQYERDFVQATLRDDGKGWRVSKGTRTRRDETGWGLINMRERASLVGGRLTVHSHLGIGSEISVRLPLIKRDYGQGD